MPANIARIDGTDQAWYADRPAWHGLGTVTAGTRTANCAHDRQQAIKDRDEAARRATLPTRMVKCATHGRRRMPIETRNMHVSNVPEAEGFPPAGVYGYIDIGIAYCPKGETLVLVSEWLAAREKAAVAKAKAEARKPKSAKAPQPGEAITFTCPNCGEVNAGGEVYLDEDTDQEPQLRVDCEFCEFAPIVAGLVKIERKAA